MGTHHFGFNKKSITVDELISKEGFESKKSKSFSEENNIPLGNVKHYGSTEGRHRRSESDEDTSVNDNSSHVDTDFSEAKKRSNTVIDESVKKAF